MPTNKPPLYSRLPPQAGTYAMNAVKGKKERIGRLMQMHANSREDVKEARTGDIVAIAGLKVCCAMCGQRWRKLCVRGWR